MGTVKSYHPSITAERRAEWKLMRDAMDGESAIKSRGETYLPMPTGYKKAADGGAALYDAYKMRAQFPELLAPSVAAMIGIIHGREIPITMPPAMEYLWENADSNGLPLEAFHRRITRELLVIGGYSVLADHAETGGDPWLAGYNRDTLINWDTDWYVLDETDLIRKGFIWEQLEKYRVLTMDGSFYAAAVYTGQTENGMPIEVRGRGGRLLPRIPLAIGNAMDLSPRVEPPPLIGVARAALAIYRKSADQELAQHMSAMPTIIAINCEGPDVVGAGVVYSAYGNDNSVPDVKMLEAENNGIRERREDMAVDRQAAVMAGARLFEQTAQGAESGEAKRLRYASETATLVSIAQSSCLLLERSLRNVAMIMGLPEDDIVVEAPTDLMDRTMSPQEFAALFGVYQQGGMSWETYFALGQRGGIFSPDTTAEDEQRLLDGPVADGGGEVI